MSHRERRRDERRKRKARAVQPATATVGHQPPVEPDNSPPVSRSEVRNQAAREALKPLGQGERPTVVTVGAVISALIALSVLGAYIAGATVDGERPHAAQVFAPALLMSTMAYGMWRARYWAVLGFQVVLLFLILGSAGGLVQASDLAEVAGRGFIFLGSGALFYFMIKAMARIQMPERRSRD